MKWFIILAAIVGFARGFYLAKADAQYINGPAPPVTAGQFCAEMRGWVGMQRQGHTLRSISCSGGGHEFTVHVRID